MDLEDNAMEKMVIYLLIAAVFIFLCRRLWVLFTKGESTGCSCNSKFKCSEACCSNGQNITNKQNGVNKDQNKMICDF